MSDNSTGVSINFFARELQEILASRGLGLGVIDDRTDIYREVVRRLQKSLVPPGNFHMLNPDDLDKVIVAFDLKPLEIIRLHAAIIANAVMQILINRIPLESALDATEKVYKDVVAAMKKGTKQFSGIRKIPNISGSLAIEEVLENMLQIVDRGISALQIREHFLDEQQRIEQLWLARTCFETAQGMLNGVDEAMKSTDTWQMWHAVVEERLSEVEEEIDDE